MAESHRQRVQERVQASRSPEPMDRYDTRMAQLEIKEQKIKELKRQQIQDEMKDCTFHPKTIDYKSHNSKKTQQINDLENQQEYYNNDDARGENAKRNNNPMPSHSLKNNERHLALYDLKKPRSALRERNAEDIEYEQNCDECTFNPDLDVTKQYYQKNFMSPIFNITSANKEIDRMRKAYEKSTKLKEQTSRGYQGLKKIPVQKNQNFSSNYNSGKNSSRSIHKPSSRQDYSPMRYQNKTFRDGYQTKQPDQNELIQPPEQRLSDYKYQSNKSDMNLEQPPLLYVDVNFKEDQSERIIIREGDRIEDLADQFIINHGLNPQIRPRLIELLEEQVLSLHNNFEQM